MAENKAHLLLVEDEDALRTAVADLLADSGFDVVQASSGEEGVAALSQFAFDVVLTDLRLPGVNGVDVLEAALLRYPDIIVIVMTGFGTVRDAVAMIKRGAADFITKPFQNDELLHVMHGALEQRRLRSENAYLRSQLQHRYRFEGLVGQSRIMRELFELLATVAATPSTILIGGETGTGKELVARAIHHNSPRRDQRFVAINCGALPESLLEAELFGHVRGAFTGAIAQRTGRFEQAHRGTLFLDEVGTMSAALQTQTAARAAGARVRARRRIEADAHRRPHHRRHQLRSRADGEGRDVPRGPVLPAERHPGAAAVAARAPRGHPAARAALSRSRRPRHASAAHRRILRRRTRCGS